MAKRISIFVIIFLYSTLSTSASERQEISDLSKYKQFGLVWGLLKYHHSEISNGKYDWNQVFIENIDRLEVIKTQEDLNTFLFDFIASLKESKNKYSSEKKEVFKNNYDYKWIDTYPFDEKLTKQLEALRDNTNIDGFYVSTGRLSNIPTFKNEKGLKGFDYKVKSHRLLLLFSFWNCIQYHYVNKYLMDDHWYEILDGYIENFIKDHSKVAFEKLKSTLIASLDDSHAYYVSPVINDSLFKYKSSFGVKNVNDTLVVTALYNKKLADRDDLELGDLILEIEGDDIKTSLEKRIKPILSTSNSTFLKKWTRWLFFSPSDSIKVKIKKKDETIVTQYLHLYENFEVEDYTSLKSASGIKSKWQFIKPDIGYMSLASISKKEVEKAFKEFSTTKGIIIDLRNYPKTISEGDITKYLYPEKRMFIKVLFPIKNRPSMAQFDEAPLNFIKDPFMSGGKNSDYYKGKVILLVNHTTQSRAEYIGMAIQASPNCTTVGENTAGSVMNIATFMMPDQTSVNFTSLGAFYPDGTSAQRNGLKIDYQVNELTSDFLQDQYLMKGIEIIESEKNPN